MTKKTDPQVLAWMRELCLALPDTSECLHYGEISFKVGTKLFASCGAKRGPRMIGFRIDPKRTEALLAADRRFARYPFEKSALAIAAREVEDWDRLRDLVVESYGREAGANTAPPKSAKRPAAKRPRRSARRNG